MANIPFSLLGERWKKKKIIVGLLKASFSEKAMKYSQMPTGFSTGSTAQHSECHAYNMVIWLIYECCEG